MGKNNKRVGGQAGGDQAIRLKLSDVLMVGLFMESLEIAFRESVFIAQMKLLLLIFQPVLL
jgi:hypothetical protein